MLEIMVKSTPVPIVTDDAARVEIVISNADPIELLDFTASLTGIAREYQAAVQRANPDVRVEETKLVIVEIRKGSTILELVPLLLPLISEYDKLKPVVDFLKDVKWGLDLLKLPGGRLPDPLTSRLKNLNDMVAVVAKDNAGSLRIAARHKEKGVIQEIVVQRDDARNVQSNIAAQRLEIEDRSAVEYPSVLMRLHQSSISEATVGRRTNEKGIIERVDDVPRPLIYASDLAAQAIKGEILRPGGNPYKKLFVVDVDVETVAGTPKAYRVRNVSDIVEDEGA
jgi:hypothetical protein